MRDHLLTVEKAIFGDEDEKSAIFKASKMEKEI
jgi:hypothetical protein